KVELTFEGRIGKDNVKAFSGSLREALGEARAERVLIVNVRIIHPVQHQVHSGDAQHSRVEVETMKHAAADMLAVRFKQIPGVDLLLCSSLWIGLFYDSFR